MKVRIQASTGSDISLIKITSDLIKNEGFSALYKGTLSPLIGNAGVVALQFGAFNMAKDLFKV